MTPKADLAALIADTEELASLAARSLLVAERRRVRVTRLARVMSLSQIAAAVGVSKSAVAKLVQK